MRDRNVRACSARRRSSTGSVAVAETMNRLDGGEAGVDELELFAQPLDVAVDGAVADVRVVGIALAHQLLARLDVAGMAGERAQDLELGDGERHGGPLPRRLIALQVEAQVADVEQALGRLRGVLADEREPAQQHPDARHELAGGERRSEEHTSEL